MPSKLKGFVTTPTVNAPCSFAILAIIGAAPVPVPPPIPAVTKTISAPFSTFAIESESSIAACSPTSGFPPAPNPPVNFEPIPIFSFAFESFNACKSVFATIKSTFSSPAEIILFTAFDPPPPTPITLIIVGLIVFLSTTENSIILVPPPNLLIYVRFFIQIP